MATYSKICNFSLKRCKTPSRRRESSPRSEEKSRKSPSTLRDMGKKRSRSVRSHFGGWHVHKTDHTTPERYRHLKNARADLSIRRIRNSGRHSESNYSDDSPRSIFKIRKSERHRDHSSRGHYSNIYETREEERRHVPRSRHTEDYRDLQSHRNRPRTAMTSVENNKCQKVESRLVIPPPLPVAVPRPRRILLPARFVPHERLPYSARVVRGGVAPVLLAPIVFLRAPMIPLRPQIQPIGLPN